MYDPRLASIDRQLRMERRIWRLQRIDATPRDEKRHTLRRIDALLEQRWAHTHQAAPQPVEPAAA